MATYHYTDDDDWYCDATLTPLNNLVNSLAYQYNRKGR